VRIGKRGKENGWRKDGRGKAWSEDLEEIVKRNAVFGRK
jgi:hypothetical protein